jgi:8-oxo-dGTP diphosphatase
MTAYVCGFAFDTENRVAVVQKKRPEWQKGLYNGIGGKIEPGETSLRAMAREFEEETGVGIHISRWKMFHREKWINGNSVDFYAVGLKPGEVPRSVTDETIQMLHWHTYTHQQLPLNHPMMYNLPYLIPMAWIHLYGSPENLPYHAQPTSP